MYNSPCKISEVEWIILFRMNAKPFTIGVLTSGGDAPGMNAAIRAVVRTAMSNNAKVLGIVNGYEGLVNGEFRPMGARDVGGILQRGGTILQTRRSERFKDPKGQREAIRHMNESGIDGLIVIGGDGSLRGAQALSAQGIKVIGIPASIDNDIWGSDMAIGVDTALNTIMDAVDKLRDTASSHSRAFIIETMGRDSGYLAVMAGIVCGADIVLMPEVTSTVGEVAHAMEDAYLRGKDHAIACHCPGGGRRQYPRHRFGTPARRDGCRFSYPRHDPRSHPTGWPPHRLRPLAGSTPGR